MPLISIVLPVFNAEKTVQETIESILNQSWTEFELIIVDDGSTDSTVDIIQAIQDPRIKLVSQPNAGVAAARNRGISEAQGGYLAFIDADDIWTPDKLKDQLNCLQNHPEAAVVYSWVDYIDEFGNRLYPGKRSNLQGNIYETLLVSNFLETGSNIMVRREALADVGTFDESLFGPEDWELYTRLAAKYEFVRVPNVQILYRMSTQSISANTSRHEKEALKAIEKVYNHAPESLKHLKKQRLAYVYQYLMVRRLEGRSTRLNSLEAARLFWNACRNNPALLKRQPRLMSILFVKILSNIILSPQGTEKLFNQLKRLLGKAPA